MTEPKPIDWLKVALELRDQARYHANEAFKFEDDESERIRNMGVGHDAAAKTLQSLAVALEKGTLR